MSFETPCKAGAVEVALQPTLAAPPLEWEPCDPPSEGCERLGNTLWKTVFAPNWQPPTYTRFSVVKTELGHRLGVRIEGNLPNLTDRWTFSVVYDEKGRASHVWRTTLRAGDDDICSLQQPLVTPSRVWMSVLHIGGDAAATTNTAFFSGAYDEVDSICDAEHFVGAHQNYAASDDILAMWVLGGSRVIFYDRIADNAVTVGAPTWDGGPSFPLPQVTASAAFVLGQTSDLDANGYVWTRETHEAVALVVPPSGSAVPLIASDGKTLVWIAGGIPTGERPPQLVDPWIWTSPHATRPEDVVPAKRLPAPPFLGSRAVANDGMLAFNDIDGTVHIYRLPDLHHWTFKSTYLSPIFIDNSELWLGWEGHVVRQRLDALGPGQPGPL